MSGRRSGLETSSWWPSRGQAEGVVADKESAGSPNPWVLALSVRIGEEALSTNNIPMVPRSFSTLGSLRETAALGQGSGDWEPVRLGLPTTRQEGSSG